MTHVQKLYIKGFKSFAKPTELVFGKNFNCAIGPNGSGKSCAPDTEVLLTDGSTAKIGELVDKELSKAKSVKFLDDGVYCISNSNTSVFTLNPETMKIENKPVAAFVRRIGEPYLYKITTKTGKSVTTTGCHPVMIFKDGCVKSEVVEKLSTGVLIASPRNIQLEEKEINLPAPNNIEARGRHNKNILFPLKTSSALGRWLGLVIGDGYINYNRIEFVNADKSLVEEFINLSKELFNISDPYVRKNGKSYRVICHSRKLSNFIYKLFQITDVPSITSGYKLIPSCIMASNLQTVAALISGLIDTDGYISKSTPTLEYTSKSEKLIDQVQLLLLRFGIVARKRIIWKYAANTAAKLKGRYLTLTIEGKEKLEKFTSIPITRIEKRRRLYFWAARDVKPNPNLDVLPKEVNLIIKELVKLVRLPVKPLRKKYPSLSAYVDDRCRPTRAGVLNIVNLAEERFEKMANALKEIQLNQQSVIEVLQVSNIPLRQASMSIGLCEQVIGEYWASGRFNATPQNLQNLYIYTKEEISTRLAKAESLIWTLKNICSSDIYWDEIVSMEKVNGTKYVYDLSILDNHNFVAHNLFVHNSNIMDALTFVLGKTSAKSMRAEKSANLIFNGGKKGSAMKEAEVSIYFDNSEKDFPLDAATIKLSRIVRVNGNSIYKINDETMTRQQVIELLATASIDPDGHNIILQGDIIHFMEMHPEERRQIIEEVAGISVYEDKKNKALNELERVEQRLREAEIILTERSTYLRELKKDRDHALKYKELEENIKSNKATYLDMQIKERNEKLEENEKRSLEHNEGINKINLKIGEVKQKILDRKTELESINKEIEQKGEIESVALQKDIENLKTDNVRNSERLNTCKNELQRLEERKKQLVQGLKDLEKTISGLQKSKADLINNEKKLVVEENELDNDVKEFKAKHGFGNQQELVELENEIGKKEEFVFKLQDQKQVFLKEKYQIDAKVNNIKERIEAVKQLESKSNIKKTRQDIKDLDEKVKKLIGEDSSLGSQLQKSRINIRMKSEELSRWQARQAGVRESLMGDLATRKILEMNKKGVYGLVSDLGKVDSKYALALEVAAGSRIKSLVVDDDKIAADCIKYLKQNRLGTATFLPLNTIKPRRESELKGSGVHGNAIDLITFDNKFKTIFSYVFGGTVVVENVDVARKLGIGKARLVTLEGDLFELSGAIIGGFRRRTKGLNFQEKEADDNLAKLNTEISELQNTISTLEKRKEELENGIKNLRNEKAGFEGELIKAEKSFGGVSLDSLKKELDLLEDEEVHKEINKIENRIFSESKGLEELKERRQKVRENAAGINNSDLANNLTTLENKKQLTHEKLIQSRTEIKNIGAQISNIYTPEKEKTLQITKQHEKDYENFKNEAEELNNLLKNQANALKDKEGQEKRFQKEYKNLFDRRIKFNEEIQKLESSTAVEDVKIREIQDRLNNLAITKAKLAAELEGLNKEYEEFQGAKLRRGVVIEVLKDEIRRFDQSMRNMGNVNMRALEIYEGIAKEYQELTDKKEKLRLEKEDVFKMIEEIEGKKEGIFMKTYKIISENFRNIFLNLTPKGEAFMELENKENPLQGGLDIKVRLVGNKYLDIKSLSGGEKTLAALAFIFAIQEHQPASFYLLDEVDAALDKKNSQLLSQLIKKYSATAQYILISHNDSVITEADQVYGVSMQENGISKIISLKL